METLRYNLSEEEFSKGRKALLWIFSGLFLLSGAFILVKSFLFGHRNPPPVMALIPLGIGMIVAVIALLATLKRKDMYFLIGEDNMEFRFGFNARKIYSFAWTDIKEIILPHKQKKVKLLFNDGSTFVINLTWIQKKKSSLIRKHIYYAAKEKNINVVKVITLT